MKNYLPFLSYSFVLLALNACSTYQAKPIHLEQDSQQWQVLTDQLCPSNGVMTKQEAQHIALLLNPDLRAARLAYAKTTAVEEFAGLWEDPSLSMDIVRVLQENVTNFGAAPAFTLPVTGLPSLAKKIASQYKEADYWKMRAQERDCLIALEQLLTRNRICHAKLASQQQRLHTCQEEAAALEKLYDLGEVDFAQLQICKQRVFDLTEEGRVLEREHLDLHLEIATLLGIHPSASERVELHQALPSSLPAALPPIPAQDLLDSPSLLSLQAAYGANEEELQREIRKQYPELSLAPAVEREDGNMKLGLGFSMSIPAWNRNREQIAASTAQRDIAGDALLSEYRALLMQGQSLQQQQRLALRHCQSESQRMQELKDILHTQENLYQLGEIDFAQLADARHQLYQSHLAYLDCLSDLLLIQVKLYSLNPHHSI